MPEAGDGQVAEGVAYWMVRACEQGKRSFSGKPRRVGAPIPQAALQSCDVKGQIYTEKSTNLEAHSHMCSSTCSNISELTGKSKQATAKIKNYQHPMKK